MEVDVNNKKDYKQKYIRFKLNLNGGSVLVDQLIGRYHCYNVDLFYLHNTDHLVNADVGILI